MLVFAFKHTQLAVHTCLSDGTQLQRCRIQLIFMKHRTYVFVPKLFSLPWFTLFYKS